MQSCAVQACLSIFSAVKKHLDQGHTYKEIIPLGCLTVPEAQFIISMAGIMEISRLIGCWRRNWVGVLHFDLSTAREDFLFCWQPGERSLKNCVVLTPTVLHCPQ